MDQVKPVIFKALVDELAAMGVSVRGIYERNDVKVRELDGMTQYKDGIKPIFCRSRAVP